jgi:thiamine biosynthesis protein ThiS
MMPKPSIPRLMLVTDRLRASGPIADVVRAAVDGGVQAVQIREKDLPEPELASLAHQICEAVAGRVPVVINSFPALASSLGIGLHLPESMPLTAAGQAQLAGDALLGRAVHTPESAAQSLGFDYVIAGHVFETSSKLGLPVLGPSRLADIVKSSPCPVLAIGGIIPERVHAVLASGAHGIAVMSGICASDDPAGRARQYLEALNGATMSESMQTTLAVVGIQVNGKPVQIQNGTTVAGFLELKGLHQNMVVVEHNGRILKRNQFAEAHIQEGDVLEVVHFVGGGRFSGGTQR